MRIDEALFLELLDQYKKAQTLLIHQRLQGAKITAALLNLENDCEHRKSEFLKGRIPKRKGKKVEEK